MSTFISYSRVNASFVVRLAKDLKTAGFDVWLDQLDIPKGARWDDAIEAAVEKSSIFMIVLAPESIGSQNVKDELSYAIDAGKHILPVVIQPCKIPLRLRRFQYVDFTDKPYKDSLSEIKHLLSNTQQIPRAPVEKPFYEKEDAVPLVKGPLMPRELPPQPEPFDFKPQVESRLRKFVIPVLLGLISMATIAVISVYASRGNRAAPGPSFLPTSTHTESLPTEELTSTPIPPPVQITDPLAGVTMRLVSAGEFIMGSDDGLPDETPAQTLYLDAFYIDKYEVSNALYRDCVAAGACQSPGRVNSVTHVAYYSRPEFDHYPVVYVDWYMAKSYCEWRGARLPTEAEWEKAARGMEGRTYPWGEQISCNEANYGGCQKDTAAVSSFGNGMSPYGVNNMAGNVYEWVSSLYVSYPYDAMDGREDPHVTGDRVIRGGSWIKSNSQNELRASRRQRADPSLSTENIGFRCVHNLDLFVPDTGGQPTATPRNSFTATSMAATNRVRNTKEAEESGSTPVPSSPTLVETLLLKATATINPLGSTATPVEKGLTPDPGGITPGASGVTPDSSGVTPASSGVTPDPGGVTPDAGDDNPPPDSGDDNPPPDSGDDNPPPDSGDDKPPPDSGADDPTPDAGGG